MKKKVHSYWGARRGRFRLVIIKGMKFRRPRKT